MFFAGGGAVILGRDIFSCYGRVSAPVLRVERDGNTKQYSAAMAVFTVPEKKMVFCGSLRVGGSLFGVDILWYGRMCDCGCGNDFRREIYTKRF